MSIKKNIIKTAVLVLMSMVFTKALMAQELKAGDIAPDAKKLEVDGLSLFFGSFAVVQINLSQALINDKADIVIPYNKYEYGLTQWKKYNEGVVRIYPLFYGSLGDYSGYNPIKLIPITKNGKSFEKINGYIQTDGTEVIPTKSGFDQEGYVFDYYGTKEFYDYKNKKIAVSAAAKKEPQINDWLYSPVHGEATTKPGYSASNNFTGGLLSTRSQKNNKIGFVDRTGTFLIAPQFDATGEFSEDVAFVAMYNEFKELRWGAIDITGKQILPFRYTFQPSRFTNGRSCITAVNQEHVEYAFINKKGDVIFTLPKNKEDTISINSKSLIGGEPFNFNEGYACVTIALKNPTKRDIYNVCLLDTNGHYVQIIDLLRKSLPEGSIDIISYIKNGTFIFMLSDNRLNGGRAYGMADIDGNILIPPVFSQLNPFEKESKVQYAEIMSREDNVSVVTKGYIDRAGIFRIVMVNKKPGY